MKKISLLLNAVLIAAIAFGAYKFIIEGSVEEANDGRTAILLTNGERDFVLGEMRGFLEAVQGIVAATGEADFTTVSGLATAVGSAAIGGETAALMGKLPIEFKTLGMATHGLFDDLAATADTQDSSAVIAELGVLMQNCTGCHAGYRFDIEPSGS